MKLLILLSTTLLTLAQSTSNLQRIIDIFLSGKYPLQDSRFKYATSRHFNGQDIGVQILSNQTGDIRFFGASERGRTSQTGYQLTYSVHNQRNDRVETKCNQYYCDVQLSKQLFYDAPSVLTWTVSTDPSWYMGAHEIASGSFFWDYQAVADDLELVYTQSVPEVACSLKSYLTKSTSEIQNPDGTVAYTSEVYGVYLRDRLCMTIRDNINDETLFIVEIVNKGLTLETPVRLATSYTYSWYQTPEILSEYWTDAMPITYVSNTELYVGHNGNSYRGCSWSDRAYATKYLQDNPSGNSQRAGIPGMPKPMITTSGKTEFYCDNKDFDMFCNSKSNVYAQAIWTYNTAEIPSNPSNPYPFKSQPWYPNYPIEGIDANTLFFFTPSDSFVKCEVLNWDGGILNISPWCLETSNEDTGRGTCIWKCKKSQWYFQTKFLYKCTSRRIRPNRFFRGFNVGVKVSKYWELDVKITDMKNPNASTHTQNMRVDLTGSNGGTVDINLPGENRVIQIITDSHEAGYNQNQFGMYEVQSGTYKRMVQNSAMPMYDTDPLIPSSLVASHTCSDEGGPCVLKNGLYNTGFGGPPDFDKKLDEFIHPQNYNSWRSLYEPVVDEITGALVGLKSNLTNLASKKISIIGSFNISEIVSIVEPSCELSEGTTIRGVCSSLSNICVKINITAYSKRSSGSVLVDISELSGAVDVQPRSIVLGTDPSATHTLCVTASTVECSLIGKVSLIGTDMKSSTGVLNVTLARDVLVTPTYPPTIAPIIPGAPISSIMSTPSPSEPVEDSPSSSLPVWAWVAIGIGALLIIGFGLVYYFFILDDTDDEALV